MSKASDVAPVLPGEWLGMIGGGQLGRMFCHAAQGLGYKVAVLDPDTQSPAGAVADLHICAAYDNENALDKLAAQCQAISTEFENVPAQSLIRLGAQRRVTPSGEAVAVVQDRVQEKAFIRSAGVPVAPYAPILTIDDLYAVPESLFPGILKVARLGYDGKGQARVATRDEALHAFSDFRGVACVLEALQPLKDEISIVVARGLDGNVQSYMPSHNEHRDGILAVSTAAVNKQSELYQKAAQAAESIAKALSYHGVLCVEFFILDDNTLLANEIAPRPHNSGHFTMDACFSSQFQQQVRVMAGLPLGDAASHTPSVMLNLLGDIWFNEQGHYQEPDWAEVLRVPGACLHLYGKTEARAGRKMGHINILDADPLSLQSKTARVASVLGISYELHDLV
ncbi:5-(carboxyamino)imidazole ribonucleotide synthase [Paenalcaligenes niemegkensis]|uniref:5-(carboxyamino)imidazole ribonucleotide synthase n=1 Tax=Paenalcaligenes niemegkensis TaxID=2895469 RepID=UPI001EE8BF39|nr:5-(carboxyamino)imidazole ribonucleotide synthase [Paenalcaligenes niemegkensis]MCQ9617141.1 5-(carboxyamino)imidazole ribonucleotide synthase [Paenalcaligenes niemegkensis]